MKIAKEFIIKPQSGISFVMEKNQLVQIIDCEGKQVADLVAFNRENKKEKLSTGVTIDNNSSLFLHKGDYLYTNEYNKMFMVIEDTAGNHDLLHPACSPPMYRYQYKITSYHPSCLGNLSKALGSYEISIEEIPNPVNLFMNTILEPDGKIRVEEPLTRSGDYILLRAEMDMILGITACSVEESKCNGFNCTPIMVKILLPD